MESLKGNQSKARLIAFYLPQFHPIPENDEWWGKGFTEWTNTAKAKPMFRGHYQPHVPTDLGFYDLQLPEARIAQAEMAREYGVEGFCYWHYWFGNGRRLLERPFNEVLKSGQPDFPFCLGWANESWSGIWHGSPKKVLMEQQYPGITDYKNHFDSVLGAFRDRRYITVEGKPLFMIYRMNKLPNPKEFSECWRSLSAKAGLRGVYLLGFSSDPTLKPAEFGFDGVVLDPHIGIRKLRERAEKGWIKLLENFRTGIYLRNLYKQVFNKPTIYSYSDFIDYAPVPLRDDPAQIPCVMPNWDNTPRSMFRGIVLKDSSPRHFKEHLRRTISQILDRDYDKRIIFLKSWNEWAEGNHVEPDLRFGRAYLDVIKDAILPDEALSCAKS